MQLPMFFPRRMPWRPAVALLATLGLACACGTPPFAATLGGYADASNEHEVQGARGRALAASHPLDPARLILVPNDLPPGFGADSKNSRPVTKIGAEFGFVAGQQVSYERSGPLSLFGPMRVQSWILVFESDDRARAWLERGNPIETRNATVVPLEAPNLAYGSRAVKLVEYLKAAPVRQTVEWTTYAINARTSNVVFVIITTGLAATADFGDALRYAELIAARIERSVDLLAAPLRTA